MITTILCEKRSAADNFAEALGGYSGTLNGSEYQIVWSMGHLFRMKPIDEMVDPALKDEYTSWEIDKLPFDRKGIRWGVMLNPDEKTERGVRNYSGRLAAIADALRRSDACIIATDVDVSGEGDLLAWEILVHLQFKGKVYRCKHEDESPVNIKKALTPANLELIDRSNGMLQRGLARQRFDFLTIQYSRVTTTTGRGQQVIPYSLTTREGRLKSAMISLIGNSEYAHETFRPSSRYTSSYIDEDGHLFVKAKSSEFDEVELAQNVVDKMPISKICEPNPAKLSKREPPALYDISSISAKLSELGYNSKTFLQVANKMYEDSIISYIRTAESQITPEQLKQLLPLVPQIATLINVEMSQIDINGFRSYVVTNEQLSHGGNRPGLKVPSSMDALRDAYGEYGPIIYEMMARSFIALFGQSSEYATRVFTDESGEYKYTVTKNTFRGWESIINPSISNDDLVDEFGEIIKLDQLSDEEKAKVLADKKDPVVGNTLTPKVREKKAKRPALATQTTLMNYLRKNNIGTGATRVQTFVDISDKPKGSKIDRRLIAVDKKGKLRLTDVGRVSYLLMKGTYLANPQVTKQLDERLEKVSKGEMTIEQILQTFDKIFADDKKIILSNISALSSLPKVAQTHKPKEKVTGTFKPTGQTVSFSSSWGGHEFTDVEKVELLLGHEISFKMPIDSKKSMADIKGDPDQMYTVYGLLRDDGDKFGFGFKQTRREYPKRKSYTFVYEPTGEEITISAKFGQYELSQEEADKLAKGEIISFVAPKKAGGTYDARVKLVYKEKWGSKTGEKAWQVAFANDDKKDN